MKKLLAYFNSLNKEDRSRFLSEVGMSENYLRRACSENVVLSAKRCVAIERATNGLISRKDLYQDDWQDIWPELEGK